MHETLVCGFNGRLVVDIAYAPPERQPWGGFTALFAACDGIVFYLDEAAAAHS